MSKPKPPRLLVEERRRRMMEILDAQERATVEELVERFGVSAVTIRGDLDALTATGAIVRSHGGALKRVDASDEPIDVKETLKKKLDVDFKRYIILGACNPPFAHKALQAEEEIGLLLPCNVIVYEKGKGSVVAAFDPMTMGKLTDNPAIEPVALEVRKRLERVIAAM